MLVRTQTMFPQKRQLTVTNFTLQWVQYCSAPKGTPGPSWNKKTSLYYTLDQKLVSTSTSKGLIKFTNSTILVPRVHWLVLQNGQGIHDVPRWWNGRSSVVYSSVRGTDTLRGRFIIVAAKRCKCISQRYQDAHIVNLRRFAMAVPRWYTAFSPVAECNARYGGRMKLVLTSSRLLGISIG